MDQHRPFAVWRRVAGGPTAQSMLKCEELVGQLRIALPMVYCQRVQACFAQLSVLLKDCGCLLKAFLAEAQLQVSSQVSAVSCTEHLKSLCAFQFAPPHASSVRLCAGNIRIGVTHTGFGKGELRIVGIN